MFPYIKNIVIDMKSYFSLRPFASFVLAVLIGAYSTSMLVQGEEKSASTVREDVAVSPELYNSAFSPTGSQGGEIIPASCSIGYPSDAADGFVACPTPTITSFFPGATASLVGGGTLTWGYTSSNAAFCDVSTTMSVANLAPSYYYVEDPNKTYNNFGPFANANGWVRYTVQCWDASRTMSDSRQITITLTRAPEVKVGFSTNGTQSPFLGITTFAPDDSYPFTSTSLRWEVTGATSCSATGGTGWAGLSVALPSGSRVVSSSYYARRTYTLTCTNGTETVVRSATVNFEGGGDGGNLR
jgi:hypothetical protein